MSTIVIERSAPSPEAITTRPARWLAAAALVAGAALQVVEFALVSRSDDNVVRVAEWSAHPAQTSASMIAGLAAVPLLMAAFAVTLAIARPQSRRLAIVTACFLALAMTGLAAVHGAELMAFSAALGGDTGTAVELLDTDVLVAPMAALLLMFLGGAAIGTILLAATIWRSSRLPRIAALGVLAFAVLDFAVGAPMVSHLVALVNSVILAWAVVSGYARRTTSAA